MRMKRLMRDGIFDDDVTDDDGCDYDDCSASYYSSGAAAGLPLKFRMRRTTAETWEFYAGSVVSFHYDDDGDDESFVQKMTDFDQQKPMN